MKSSITILFIFSCLSCTQVATAQTRRPVQKPDYWLLITDTLKDEYGYRNIKGDTVVPLGKYGMCFTDTFRNYAIVANDSGFIAINRQQQVLYRVFEFDNGPDYPSEGLFRIIENGLIGYASSATGRVVIKPQFSCAYPFEGGKAEVGHNCTLHSRDDHYYWLAEDWYYIDRKGNRLKGKVKKL